MHLRRALALSLAVPLLLAGCTEEEPTPKIPNPTTSSATPTPEETETAKPESAEEFIRRWAEIEAEMENTGDTSDYREISADCAACTDLADLVEEWYGAGGFIKWGGWEIESVRLRGEGQSEYVVRVDSSPTKYKESKNGPLRTFDGGPGAHLIVLEEQGNSWVVVRKAEVPR